MKTHYSIQVLGKVQGVWFRKYTKNKAVELQLKGFVRNEEDGSVYIEVEGKTDSLETFIDWLYSGSPLAKVTHVNFTQKELKNFDKFEVQR